MCGAPTARADDDARAVTLRWTAPAECPDGAYVQGEIARLLGGQAQGTDAHVDATAVATHPAGGSWHVDLVTHTASSKGARALDADSCRALADATALILAMMVNPTKVLEVSASASSSLPPLPAPTTPAASSWSSASSAPPAATAAPPLATTSASPPPTASAPRDDPAPATSSTSAARARWSIAAGGLVDAGSFPSIAFGATASLAVTAGALRVEAAGSYVPSARTSLADRPGSAVFSLTSASLRVGVVLPFGARWLEWTPVAGVELAQIKASSDRIASPAEGTTGRTSVSLGVIALLPLGSAFALRLLVEGLAPLQRTEFVIDQLAGGQSVVHREPLVVGRASLGVSLRF